MRKSVELFDKLRELKTLVDQEFQKVKPNEDLNFYKKLDIVDWDTVVDINEAVVILEEEGMDELPLIHFIAKHSGEEIPCRVLCIKPNGFLKVYNHDDGNIETKGFSEIYSLEEKIKVIELIETF